jgi:Lon protease-like protein
MKHLTIDLNEIVNLEGFSGLIPIFPLSTVVFFPNTLLPLHIFEPRYKQMIRDIKDAEGIIGMALLKPGWERGLAGNPEFYETAGMGRIVSIEPLEDGRYNIVLYGLKRVRIVEVVRERPYTLARVEVLKDQCGTGDEALRRRMIELIAKWNALFNEKQEKFKIKIDLSLPLAPLTDLIASTQISSIMEKQQLLQETNVERRAEKIISYIETIYKAVSIIRNVPKHALNKSGLN